MDSALVGCWRVQAIDMIAGRTVRLIGGRPEEYVEFTEDGRYRIDLTRRRPDESRYRATPGADLAELDIWIDGLEPLGARGVYRVASDSLTICVAGDSGTRPTELRRDDQRLWCVITLERSAPPKRGRSGRVEPLLEPGALIPKTFVKKGRSRPRGNDGSAMG